MLGKNEGQMRKGQQRISGLYSITDSLGRGDFPDSSVGKEFSCNARDSSSITESGRSTGEGIGYPLQHSWASLVAQLAKNSPAMWEAWVWSQDCEYLLEKRMLPTPVFWSGEFHELYNPWGHKKLDMTERLSLALTQWTWIWENSGKWWRAEEPGVLQSMGSQKVRHEQLNTNKI